MFLIVLLIKTVSIQKVLKFTYCTLLEKCFLISVLIWQDLSDDDPGDLKWEDTHLRNFKCSIDSRLRSVCFMVYHNAIAFNNFLFKIKGFFCLFIYLLFVFCFCFCFVLFCVGVWVYVCVGVCVCVWGGCVWKRSRNYNSFLLWLWYCKNLFGRIWLNWLETSIIVFLLHRHLVRFLVFRMIGFLLIFSCLCVKYYSYVCKFQSKRPYFTNLIVFMKIK